MNFGLISVAFAFPLLPFGLTFELPEDSDHSGASCLILASIITSIASFALGLGNVASMQNELYPLAVRSLGSVVTGNFVMCLMYLPLMYVLSPSWTFVLYSGICTAGHYPISRYIPRDG